MRLLGKVLAVMLAAMWLPLTVHCGLEAAGLWPAHEVAADSHCCDDGERCTGCDVVEGGEYAPAATAVKAAVPDVEFQLWSTLHCLLLPGADRELDYPFRERAAAPEWVASWNFVRRAASSPRAPALIA